jgi:prephenate dehydrogenase
MRVAVLGVGLIGGSIGLAGRERISDAEVVGFDPRADALAAASSRGAIDRAADDPRTRDSVRAALKRLGVS